MLASGAVETHLVDRMLLQKEAKQWTVHTPLHRCAPEDVAGSAVFLCSDDASFITGHVFVVDDGLSLEASPWRLAGPPDTRCCASPFRAIVKITTPPP